MSKVNKMQLWDSQQTRRTKVITMLLSEIIFLRANLKKAECRNDQMAIIKALNKLEYILDTLESNESGLSDEEFDKFIILVYKIFRTIVNELEK